jgi:transcriptional regulator with XRE-family HTH domain
MYMAETQGVATTRRRLRTELRRLREVARLHQSEVVKELDWSISKLIRIENGSVGISVTDLRALAGVYAADPETIEELVKLARVTRERQWWSAYRHILSPTYREFIGYESDAAALMHMHPTIVPGLLQTEAYVRAIIPSTLLAAPSAERLEALVSVRLKRQDEILNNGHPPEYTAVIDEAALRRQVGGVAVMRDQLAHLATLAEKTARLAVLPFGAGGHPGLQGAFHIMEFASSDEESVLFLETALGNPIQREPQEVALYREAFHTMLERSVRGDDATDFIRRVAGELG